MSEGDVQSGEAPEEELDVDIPDAQELKRRNEGPLEELESPRKAGRRELEPGSDSMDLIESRPQKWDSDVHQAESEYEKKSMSARHSRLPG